MNYYDPFFQLLKIQKSQIDRGIYALEQKLQQRNHLNNQKKNNEIHGIQSLINTTQQKTIILQTKKKQPLTQISGFNNKRSLTPQFNVTPIKYDYVQRVSTLRKKKSEFLHEIIRDRYLQRFKKNENVQKQNIDVDKQQISPKMINKANNGFETPYDMLQTEKLKTPITKRKKKKGQKKKKKQKQGQRQKTKKQLLLRQKQLQQKLRQVHEKQSQKERQRVINNSSSNKKISNFYKKYQGSKRQLQLRNITPLGQQKIVKRIKSSAVVFTDSQHRHEKHEQDHLFFTHDNQIKMRKQLINKISLHPLVIKKHGLSVL